MKTISVLVDINPGDIVYADKATYYVSKRRGDVITMKKISWGGALCKRGERYKVELKPPGLMRSFG